MDNRLFDDLAKRVATERSRRSVIKGLAGAALGLALGSARSAKAANGTPIAGECAVDGDCGADTICCSGACQAVVCCAGDPNDTHCGSGEFCDNSGLCSAIQGSCSVDSDCNPCYDCVNGGCQWQCGTGLGATCDGSSGTHGTCRFDCRACEGDACCPESQACNRDNGLCVVIEHCQTNADCDACSACTSGVCVTSCGPCQACEQQTGLCVHDCRMRNNCCASDHVCDQTTGACVIPAGEYGTLVIKKVDKKGAPLTGACFDLLKYDTGEPLTSQPHCDGGFGDSGGADGQVIFANNVRGIFGVRETVPPAGYTAAPNQTTPNIAAGQTVTITFVDDPIVVAPTPTTGGSQSGESASGGGQTTTSLPNTGVGDGNVRESWLAVTGALVGGAAALLGGLRLRKSRHDA